MELMRATLSASHHCAFVTLPTLSSRTPSLLPSTPPFVGKTPRTFYSCMEIIINQKLLMVFSFKK
jgi:hypothetical protein